MHEGPDFLDRACSIGETRREVWDVNWGSCFPCANGSVSEIVFGGAVRTAGKPVPVPSSPAQISAFYTDSKSWSATQGGQRPAFMRPQTLHVIHCTRGTPRTHASMHLMVGKWVYRSVTITVLLAIVLVSCFSGMYGTMAAALISIVFRICSLCIAVVHPSSYLGDNERGLIGSACMLVANHQNASTWYLFTGDRGVVDGVLNKNMIFSIESKFGGGVGGGKSLGTKSLIVLLRMLAFLQVLVLTFVAAQKGWDGIGLLIFITIAWVTEKLSHNDTRLFEAWKKQHGIELEARTFEFTGRVAMIGAIQVFNENRFSCWMDSILVPNKKRDMWLKKLADAADDKEAGDDEFGPEECTQLGDDGVRWVRDNLSRARTAAKVMKMCFTQP